MKTHWLIFALKNILRSKGITYSKLAKKLNLSETSIKRMMSGQTPMTIQRMDEICEVINVDVFELLKLTKKSTENKPYYLTLDQEHALTHDTDLFICFYGLAKGLSINEITTKYNITQIGAQKALFKLKNISLIDLLPANKVRFLVSRTVRWKENGPLAKKYLIELENDFLDNTFSKNSEVKKFLTFPLSERSKFHFNRKFKEFINELQAQSEIDLAMNKSLKNTSTLLVGFREWTPSILKKFMR